MFIQKQLPNSYRSPPSERWQLMCVLLGANEGVLGDELLLRLDIPEDALPSTT